MSTPLLCLSACLSICLPLCLSVSLCVDLSIFLCAFCVSACISIFVLILFPCIQYDNSLPLPFRFHVPLILSVSILFPSRDVLVFRLKPRCSCLTRFEVTCVLPNSEMIGFIDPFDYQGNQTTVEMHPFPHPHPSHPHLSQRPISIPIVFSA